MFNAEAVKMINEDRKIIIASGEGEKGYYSVYKGKRTERAIKIRLTKEKCNGDRWARAYIYSHEDKLGGRVYVNIEDHLDLQVVEDKNLE